MKLLGVAARGHAGKRAEIRFLATGKVVARPVVGADGRFAATAPMPAAQVCATATRRATTPASASERSLALKLAAADDREPGDGRRRQGDDRRPGERAARRARGRPRDRGPARAVVLEDRGRRERSSRAPDGRFKVTVDAPAGERAAVYRLRTRVRRSAASPKLFETFTLPRAVDF